MLLNRWRCSSVSLVLSGFSLPLTISAQSCVSLEQNVVLPTPASPHVNILLLIPPSYNIYGTLSRMSQN